MKRIIILFAIAFILGILMRTFAASGLDISVPSLPARGQPFFVSVNSNITVESFHIKWQGIERDIPAIVADNGESSAEFLLPARYDEHGKFTLEVSGKTDGRKLSGSLDIDVADREYEHEELTVDPKFIKVSKENRERAAKERVLAGKAIKTFSTDKLWTIPFARPVQGDISDGYGIRRVFNGKPNSIHSGLDFRAKQGDEIHAVMDGTVVLTADFFYSGRCVFVDHGLGVMTVYMHQSKLLVKKGDKLKTGDVVGLVGATGRVTGPHLHLHLYVQGVAVDPAIPLGIKTDK
ncbi:M23 family metallopeptidase [Deferribacterales bacterium RsTz2092]|nr:peptidase M24 [Deferribacterales bacterium]